jgi:ABC-2 type transport system permease protein
MLHYARLVRTFFRTSLQQELAYRTNLFIGLLHTVLNLGSGVLALWVLFGQVESIRGWSFGSTLALLGVYLTVGALRSLVISPSLDALTGMDGEVWDGRFDFTLLRPADIQFLASTRHWRLFALVDLFLGAGVLVVAVHQLGRAFEAAHLLTFVVAMGAGLMTLYALLLFFAGLVFWSPGFLFSWVFDGLFQLARYPVGLYPAQLQLILTWVIPVGVITTFPAEALTGGLSPSVLAGSVTLAVVLVIGASAVFRSGVRRYASASS